MGKSSLLHQFAQHAFKEDYRVTIGVEFVVKQVQIDGDAVVTLQIWDTVWPFVLHFH